MRALQGAHVVWTEVASTRWLQIDLVLFGQDELIVEPRYMRCYMVKCAQWMEYENREAGG